MTDSTAQTQTTDPTDIAPGAVAVAGATPAPSTALAKFEESEEGDGTLSAFSSRSAFATAQRMATALAGSTIVPDIYRGNVPNCLIALELSSRTGASVMMVMQNLYIVSGKPGWSGVFLISSVNTSGRFSPLRYEVRGEPMKPGWGTRALARDLKSGELLDGEWITTEMVVGEGWSKKSGSKWLTMPGQMGRYRAASFWTRAFAPEISLGMRTLDELEDITDVIPHVATRSEAANALNRALGTVTATSPAIAYCEECGEPLPNHGQLCPTLNPQGK